MKNPARVLAIPAFVVLAATSLWAQSSPPPAAAPAPAPKLAIVDIRAALLSTAEGKQEAAAIQSQFSAKQAELENMRKNLEDLQKRVTDGARTLSDDERARLERQGQRMQQQLQRKQEEYQADMNEVQQDALERLGRKMGEVVSRYARENNFLMVMDAQVCTIYCSNQLDITQDVIRLYDQAYPVKGGAPPANKPAAGAPASAKPAQPTTTPPPAKPKP